MANSSEILNRIKSYYSLRSNVELAEFLEETPQNISNWYSRGTLNYQKVIEKCKDVDLNWIFRGRAFRSRASKSYSVTAESEVGLAADVEASYGTVSPVRKPRKIK